MHTCQSTVRRLGLAPCIFIYDPVGSFGILSNFAATPFTASGTIWQSVEHYYQTAKFVAREHRELVRTASSGAEAKRLAWSEKLHGHARQDWDSIREGVMRTALRAKFTQFATANLALQKSWPLSLLEDSGDDLYWGIGPTGAGDNRMGALLESLRRDLFALPTWLHPDRNRLRIARASSTHVDWTSCTEDDPKISVRKELCHLAFNAFTTMDAESLIAKQLGTGARLEDEVRGSVFDAKYANYSWFQDARSAVPNWINSFYGLIATASPHFEHGNFLVVGAGSSNEAQQVWNFFRARATLCDIGEQSVANCSREAPLATVHRQSAEALTAIADSSQDIYFALRTYESSFLNIEAALGEARRILKREGKILISVSNGYLTAEGSLVHGQIVGTGIIDLLAPWKMLSKIATIADEIGFREFSFFDLESEVGFIATSS
jgi:N-glycosidase YbiA